MPVSEVTRLPLSAIKGARRVIRLAPACGTIPLEVTSASTRLIRSSAVTAMPAALGACTFRADAGIVDEQAIYLQEHIACRADVGARRLDGAIVPHYQARRSDEHVPGLAIAGAAACQEATIDGDRAIGSDLHPTPAASPKSCSVNLAAAAHLQLASHDCYCTSISGRALRGLARDAGEESQPPTVDEQSPGLDRHLARIALTEVPLLISP